MLLNIPTTAVVVVVYTTTFYYYYYFIYYLFNKFLKTITVLFSGARKLN